jgi:hypothetical protein
MNKLSMARAAFFAFCLATALALGFALFGGGGGPSGSAGQGNAVLARLRRLVGKDAPGLAGKALFPAGERQAWPQPEPEPWASDSYALIAKKDGAVLGLLRKKTTWFVYKSQLLPVHCGTGAIDCVRLPNGQLVKLSSELRRQLPSVTAAELVEKTHGSQRQSRKLRY